MNERSFIIRNQKLPSSVPCENIRSAVAMMPARRARVVPDRNGAVPPPFEGPGPGRPPAIRVVFGVFTSDLDCGISFHFEIMDSEKGAFMTTENDVVLIYLQEKPLSYARIESITPDHKRGWFQVKLLLLQIPLQAVTWILRDAYIDGETFTMNGNAMRLEQVVCPGDEPGSRPHPKPNQEGARNAKVISLAQMKKNTSTPPNPS